MRNIIFSLGVLALSMPGYSLTNPNFDTNGSGWGIYPGASAITFTGGQAHLNKPVADGCALYQDEAAFTGPAYRATFVVTAVTGSFAIGWQNPGSAWAAGSPVIVTVPGTYNVDCTDSSFKTVNAGEVSVGTQFTASIDSINTLLAPAAGVENWDLY